MAAQGMMKHFPVFHLLSLSSMLAAPSSSPVLSFQNHSSPVEDVFEVVEVGLAHGVIPQVGSQSITIQGQVHLLIGAGPGADAPHAER